MSVDVQVEGLRLDRVRLVHFRDGAEETVAEEPEDGAMGSREWRERHLVGCEHCQQLGDVWVESVWDTDGLPRVNMANGNAGTVLSSLGYEGLEGVEKPAVLRMAIERALARPELGVRAGTQRGGPGTGEPYWVEYGQDSAAYRRRLQRILEVVDAAERLGRDVVWY